MSVVGWIKLSDERKNERESREQKKVEEEEEKKFLNIETIFIVCSLVLTSDFLN